MAVNGCCIEWEQEITLYLDGELPSESRSRVERHLKKCPCCSRFFYQLEREEHLLAGKIRHQAIEFLPPPDFCNRVMDALPPYVPNLLTQRLSSCWQQVREFFTSEGHRHMALAASMVICLMGILLSLQAGDVKEPHYIHLKVNGILTREILPEIFVPKQINGEYYEFPDSSTVFASYGSHFIVDDYPQDNQTEDIKNERRLILRSGEIFVDVQPARESFTILTANTQITVFGTQFYVWSKNTANKETVVAVRKGSVMVERRGNNQMGSVRLESGQQTIVSTKDGKTSLHVPEPVDADLMASF